MELKCGNCGESFSIPDSEQGTVCKCPKCAAEVILTRESKARPVHRFLSPLELGVILAVLIVIVAVIIWKGILTVPEVTQAPTTDKRPELQRQAEAAIQDECGKNMTTIAAAILEFKKKNKVFPPDLNTLKEAGLLSPGVALGCEKAKYTYLGAQADACADKVSDPIILCDSSEVHLGGRNVARASGSVEFMQESDVTRLIAEMEKEYEKLLTGRAREGDIRKKREREAASIYQAASEALSQGKLDDALEAYERLLKEFPDTKVVSETRQDIEDSMKTIGFQKKMEQARELVEAGKLDEARKAFDQIASDVPAKEAQNLAAEREILGLLIEASGCAERGEHSSALAIYSSVAHRTGSPFWKKVAHRESQKIETYQKAAQQTYNLAETAEKEGKLVKALALYTRILADYAMSEYAPKATIKRSEIAKKTDYGKRFLSKNLFLSPDVTASISAGLSYLTSVQQENGSWVAGIEGDDVLDPLGVTGLCLLAFLGEGHTSISGSYKEAVSKAVGFITSAQKEDGLIGDSASKLYRYSHAICTLALCELKVMTEDELLGPVCEKALKYILKIQEPTIAFRRTPDDTRGDTQLTAWMLLAMLSAHNAGIQFHEGLCTVCLNHFDRVTDERGRANYSAPKDPSKPERQSRQYQSMLTDTAAATLGRLLLGVSLDDTRLSTSLNFLRDNQPNRSWINFPFYFFAAAAKFQAGEQGYRVWLSSLKSILLAVQISEGDKKGSWDIGQFADMRGGRTGETALAVLSLQVPYNHFAGINRREAGTEKPKRPEVMLTLKDDTKIVGRLVSEDQENITIEVTKDGTSAEVTYPKGELKKIEHK
jgi:tetratricopeptide (TPR) repeat protein